MLALQAAVKKAPKPDLSKAEQKRLRQEKDPNFKAQSKSNQKEAAANAKHKPAEAGNVNIETPKRKARGIGFDETADKNKKQKTENPIEQK